MSLLFFDGFDQYADGNGLTLYGKWLASANPAGFISSTVRVGVGKRITLNTVQNSVTDYKVTVGLANQISNTVYLGFALSWPNTVGGDSRLCAIETNAGVEQCSLHLIYETPTTYRLQLMRGATVLTIGTIDIAVDTWRYIELKVMVDAATGIFECKVDGTVYCTFTGNTKNDSANELSRISLCSPAGNFSNFGAKIDDFYVVNSLGNINNTYLGEQLCQIMNPSTDVAITWSRNSGTTNHGQVADPAGSPDGDTTYVSANVAGSKDVYGYAGLVGMNAVTGVKLFTRAEKDNVNPKSFAHGIKVGTVEQTASYQAGIGYSNHVDIFETKDGVNAPFTSADITNLESIIEVL